MILCILDDDANPETNTSGLRVTQAFIRIAEIFMMVIKLMEFMKVYEEVGQLVQLIGKVFTDIKSFTFFFILYVLVFALTAQVLEL